MPWTVFAAIALAAWLFLVFGRGGFWRVSKQIARRGDGLLQMRRIAAIVPARNEAECIFPALRSLLSQRLPGELRVLVVDDNSSDGTAAIAREAANQSGQGNQLTIVPGALLAPGWTGKLWAVEQGVAVAEHWMPDYYLFTDADIVHGAGDVAQLIQIAEQRGCDLASYMVKLACHSFAEKALIPAFVFFFFMVYPPGLVPGAAGGCILLKRSALEQIGGIASIRQEVIDDCALARAVSRTQGKIWLGLTETTHSIRSYGTFREILRMISRTAFNQLGHSGWLLLGTVAGLVVTFVLPVVLLFSGRLGLSALGGLSWLLMSIAYAPMVRFYGRPVWWAATLPLVACFYLVATVHSAVEYWRGRGGEWKGRVQDRKK